MNLFDVYPLFNINLVRAEGCWLWDDQDTKYLDLYGGHAVISIGHSHPHYVKALQSQLANIGFYSNSVTNPLQEQLAQTLGKVSGLEEYQLFLCNSGAEANENALKVASFVTGRKKVLAFKKAFHGRTSGAVAATDNPAIIAPFNAGHDIAFVPLNDPDAFQQALTSDVAAVIMEGIQGVGGIRIPDDSFMQFVAKKTKEAGALLILDEIQSGYGRTGKFFAFQHAGIVPDLVTTAKGMGNGFPIGGVMIHPSIKSKYGMLGATFGGNYLASVAGLAVLEVINREDLMDNASAIGKYLIEELRKVEGIQDVRGRGLMIGFDLPASYADVRTNLLKKHRIFTGESKPNTIRLLPPLSLTKSEVDLFLKALNEEMSTVSV